MSFRPKHGQYGQDKYRPFEKVSMPEQNRTGNKSRIPKNSLLFEKVIPALLILMGIITLGLVLFAAGVLLGFVRF
ncbi:MAG: hypothetical protein Q8L41_03315 [Anaerolineales bacterium]|nr:hypothetical protein [Anaerolineales bacterium]MDP2776579.1 hypothetical protein [Anaerolineales bacterium]